MKLFNKNWDMNERLEQQTIEPKVVVPAELQNFFSSTSANTYQLGDHQIEDLRNIFDQVREWNIDYITLEKKGATFFQVVGNVQFPRLKNIDIRKNKIRSVEGISRIGFPCLQTLLMGCNQVVRIRQMRKMQCPSLNNIDIDQNYINDGQTLTQLQMPKIMHEFDLEWPGTHPMCDDCNWFFKVEGESITHFLIESSRRINNQATKKWKDKYVGAHISLGP